MGWMPTWRWSNAPTVSAFLAMHADSVGRDCYFLRAGLLLATSPGQGLDAKNGCLPGAHSLPPGRHERGEAS